MRVSYVSYVIDVVDVTLILYQYVYRMLTRVCCIKDKDERAQTFLLFCFPLQLCNLRAGQGLQNGAQRDSSDTDHLVTSETDHLVTVKDSESDKTVKQSGMVAQI